MIIKITPDKEKVKSMMNLIDKRIEFVSQIDFENFPTMAAEGYYEIVKELAIALLSLDGLKAVGENAHKEAIEKLSSYEDFSESEIFLLNDLRVKRNKSSYEGKQIEKSYIENKKDKINEIINKLKKIVIKKLEKK